MEDNLNNEFNTEPPSFGLPEGYFQKSAGSIFNKIEWQEEHKDFPNLVRVKDLKTFSVPENYFADTELRLELTAYDKLRSIQKNSGFNVPVNYFEEAKDRSTFGISGDVESLPAKLTGFKKQNNFEVSAGYFEKNALKLNELLGNKKPARVINLFSKKVGYAMAAMLLVVFGFWTYDYYFTPVAIQDCGTIACVDKIDLVKTKNLENLDNEELYELVNPTELEKKLDKKESSEGGKKATDSSLKDLSTEDLLDEI
jgi:hypothetical protein